VPTRKNQWAGDSVAKEGSEKWQRWEPTGCDRVRCASVLAIFAEFFARAEGGASYLEVDAPFCGACVMGDGGPSPKCEVTCDRTYACMHIDILYFSLAHSCRLPTLPELRQNRFGDPMRVLRLQRLTYSGDCMMKRDRNVGEVSICLVANELGSGIQF
jgi:hypothetical protein